MSSFLSNLFGSPLPTEPDGIKKEIIRMDFQDQKLDDNRIDEMLDIPKLNRGREYTSSENNDQEQLVYEGTEYDVIREVLTQLNPKANDIVYDLGSGYGRFVLYGAITFPAKFIGIEMVARRNRIAENTKKGLNIPNAEFITGHVMNYDFSEGTLFFLFNPFSKRTLPLVEEKLNEIGKQRPIKVATYHIEFQEKNIPALNSIHVVTIEKNSPIFIYQS